MEKSKRIHTPERDFYMMWSKLRQKIRGFITPELQDRVDIHCTCYHDAHDDHGEAWITLDGKKIFGGGYFQWYLAPIPERLESEFSIQHGFHKEFYEVKIQKSEIEAIMKSGIHETSHITCNLGNYLNTPLEDSLRSNNPIYKAFALIDRRLGKRKFGQIELAENEHPLVRIFYELRKECFTKRKNPETD